MKICSPLSGAVKMQIRLTFCPDKFELKAKEFSVDATKITIVTLSRL